jgi:hypothetical protein
MSRENQITTLPAPSIKLLDDLRAITTRSASGEIGFIGSEKEEIGRGIKRLLGCYPAGKPADPQVYVAAVTAVLANYPNEIVRRVTDPVSGLPSRCKFLPTIAELTEACGELMRPYRQELEDAKRLAKQDAERADREKYRDPEMQKKVNAAIDKWKSERRLSASRSEVG